jgi:hypothetical protein
MTTQSKPPTGHQVYERFIEASPDEWETGIRQVATLVRQARHGVRVSARVTLRAFRRLIRRLRRPVRMALNRAARWAGRATRGAGRYGGGRLDSLFSRPIGILRIVTLPGIGRSLLIDARGLSSSEIASRMPDMERTHLVLTDDPNVVTLRQKQIPYEYIPQRSGNEQFDDWLDQRLMWLRQAYALSETMSFDELLADL